MKTIQTILVAIDFSDDSFTAANYAADLAKDVNAAIRLVHVVNKRDLDMIEMVATRNSSFPAEKYAAERVQDRKAQLGKLANDLGRGDVAVASEVRVGVPYDEILKTIDKEKADLLVMGTKGRSDLVDLVIGSCAREMFRRSPIPLLSLRIEASEDG
jgi:nucleotide-binding universal stress UspA family protein